MKKYITLDSDGYVICSGFGTSIPEEAIEADIDFSEQPSALHKFHYESKQWIDCSPYDLLEKHIKAKRDTLLLQTDWTQLNDIPESTRVKYQAYRQELRDITLQSGFPNNVTFPEKPE